MIYTSHAFGVSGDVTKGVEPVIKEFQYSSKALNEYYSTGLYLLPGKHLTVTILNEENDISWRHFEVCMIKVPEVWYTQNYIACIYIYEHIILES